mmetsp:Transcript_37249/g.60698  ORF Transcript_37249/g.60698 Transcript_37249/m.60698 type:complete len:83 (+) Transcript_37249:181-429(+)
MSPPASRHAHGMTPSPISDPNTAVRTSTRFTCSSVLLESASSMQPRASSVVYLCVCLGVIEDVQAWYKRVCVRRATQVGSEQ